MTQIISVPKERDCNLDLLRIVSMFLIVSLHSMHYGGLYDRGYSMGGVSWLSAWFTFENSVCLLSVNLYVLLSGYFLVKEKFRISKLFKIVCEVLFYSWTILVFKCLYYGNDCFDLKMILSSLLPVTYIEYWFVSAYVAMYVLMPVLNSLINNCDAKKLFGIICIFLSVFSVLNTVLPLSQVQGISRFGQSLAWFVVLYTVGAYIRLYVRKDQWKNASKKTIFLSIIFLNLWWLCTTFLVTRFGFDISNERVQFLVKWHFTSDSFPVFMASVALFQLYRSLKITNTRILKMIKILTPLVFGVYLIHHNPHLIDLIWMRLKNLHVSNSVLPFVAILYTIAVFVICLAIDYIRYLLFSILYRQSWYRNMVSGWDKIVYEKFDNLYSLLSK